MEATVTTLDATIIPEDNQFVVWVNGEEVFRDPNKIECYFWCSAHDYTVTN